MERFWSKVLKTDYCWEWTAARTGSGYGNFAWEGRWWPAHRVAWILTNGPIPSGMELDHFECANKGCVNPAHLEPVAYEGRVNTKRAYAKRTHCINGHEYTPETTYTGQGHRACKICRNTHAREAHRRASIKRQIQRGMAALDRTR